MFQTSSRTDTLSKSVLLLRRNHVLFDTPSQKVSVFFDECNQEIITLNNSGRESKTTVTFQSTDRVNMIQFTLPVEKRILSIKLNSSRTVLAYHVEKSNIEFINVRVSESPEGSLIYELEERRYVHSSRTKNSKLFGFLWTGPMEVVMITDISIEYYHVDKIRARLRHLKSFQSSTNWFVYQPPSKSDLSECANDENNPFSILMVSSGSLGSSMQPYMFSRDQMIKLVRFDVEGNWHGSDKLELFERSITIASIYGRVRLLVLQHESLNFKSRGAQILIYTVDHESGETTKTHTLDLDASGKFAINILDNLIIAHDHPSKSSFVFDIMIESTEKSDCPKHFVSLIDSQPIRALRLDDKGRDADMYSLNWVFFQPNFIIDAKLGFLSTLHLDLVMVQDIIQDNNILLNFLANRKNSEEIILSKCKSIVADSLSVAIGSTSKNQSPLADVSSTLATLSKLVVSAPEIEKKAQNDKPATSKILTTVPAQSNYAVMISQDDVQRVVFRQLEPITEQDHARQHFVSSTLLEFIFAVRKEDKNVDFCIYEQLVKCLVHGRQFYQINQMIRSAVLTDSKQLACFLLSLRNKYRPAGQLGLDMLHRLDCLTDLIESMSLSPNPSMLHSEASTRLSLALNQSLDIEAP